MKCTREKKGFEGLRKRASYLSADSEAEDDERMVLEMKMKTFVWELGLWYSIPR